MGEGGPAEGSGGGGGGGGMVVARLHACGPKRGPGVHAGCMDWWVCYGQLSTPRTPANRICDRPNLPTTCLLLSSNRLSDGSNMNLMTVRPKKKKAEPVLSQLLATRHQCRR